MSKSKASKKEMKEMFAVDKPKKTVKSVINSFVTWVDRNVLPPVAIVALAGLAVKGLAVYLPMLSDTASLTASIAVVAFLLVKAKSEK